jgi:hypothetical protein
LVAEQGLDIPTGREVSLETVVEEFSVADRIALGDLGIRRGFAAWTMVLFALSNLFVMGGLGLLAWHETHQIALKLLNPADRIVDAKVVMTLLGATTVQLGTVVFTIARAIFPTGSEGNRGG